MPAGSVPVDAAPLQTSWPERVRMTPRARSSRASLSPRSRSSATISVPSGITRLGRSPPPRTLSGANEKANTRGDGGGGCGPDGRAADDGGETSALEGARLCTDDARYRQRAPARPRPESRARLPPQEASGALRFALSAWNDAACLAFRARRYSPPTRRDFEPSRRARGGVERPGNAARTDLAPPGRGGFPGSLR